MNANSASSHIRVFYVANKRLPDNDYRLAYREVSQTANVVYGLPGRPDILHPLEFVELGFGEGVGIWDPIRFLSLIAHLRKHRHDYDVVHFFSTKLQLVGALCAALAGLPSVNTITGFGRTFNRTEFRYRLMRPVYLALMRISVSFSMATFFQNRGDMEWLAQRMPRVAHKMAWVGSGVEARIVTSKKFREQPLVVLMVGRIMADKGVPVFIEAARRLRGTNIRFVLVGPPSVGQNNLYRQVVEEHERGIIDYRGELGQVELGRVYGQSHIFAFPSRYGEGMPRVMLEAGHALLCPVASDICAHRDLIRSGRGFLLPRDTEVESLICHIRRLNGDRTELERNARGFQEHILDQYTLNAYAKRMDGFLQRLFPVASVCVKPPTATVRFEQERSDRQIRSRNLKDN